jgi:hypothetical protein
MLVATTASSQKNAARQQLQQSTQTMSHDTVQDYGAAAASPSERRPNGVSSPLSGTPLLAKSGSYHGLVQRAENSPSQIGSAITVDSLVDEEDEPPLPTYGAFRRAHLRLDLPITLVILAVFLLIAMFGWPVQGSPYPHRLQVSKVILGAISWLASEAIRKRLFRFLGSFSQPIISSTAFLLLVHTMFQESLRLFAVSLLNHKHLDVLPQPILTMVPARPPRGFFRAFDLALGFAAAESIWRTLELLGMLKLYKGEQLSEFDAFSDSCNFRCVAEQFVTLAHRGREHRQR